MSSGSASISPSGFVSGLDEAPQRFLAHVTEYAYSIGQRRPTDFIRCFGPADIMSALTEDPEMRGNILELTIGVRRKVAVRKTPASCAEDLRIALEEGETDAETIVQIFGPDDQVRHLDTRRMWAFLGEGEPWTATPSHGKGFVRAKDYVLFIMERALVEGLLAHQDIVQGVTVEVIAEHLPRAELARILEAALVAGSASTPFREEDLLAAAPCATLVEHVPLAKLWHGVVEPRIAQTYGFASLPARSRPGDRKRSGESGIPEPIPTAGSSFPRGLEHEEDLQASLESEIDAELRSALTEDDGEDDMNEATDDRAGARPGRSGNTRRADSASLPPPPPMRSR